MIRHYQPDDLRGCAEVFRDAFAEEPWKENWSIQLAETRISELMNTPLSVGFVYEEAGTVYGVAAGRAVTYLYGREYVIDEFCMSPKVQGRGIGSGMLRHIMDEMSARGFAAVVLQTTKGFPSERFYQKNGFVQSPDMITMHHKLNGA